MTPIMPQASPTPAPIDTRTAPTASPSKTTEAAPARSFAATLRAAATTNALASPAAETGVVRNVLQNVAAGHREMDRIIKLAQSGRSFSSAQLIGLQARVFRLSTEIDLASKLLEKVTSGVKQTMSTQV